MAKPLRNGRDKERVVMLTHSILRSEAWEWLPPPACKLLIELRRRYNGFNNGDISFSCREAAKVANCSKSSASRHLDTLIAYGFIDMHNKGVMRNRYASTWYLTMERCSYNPKYPTNRWREFRKIDGVCCNRKNKLSSI